MIPELKIYKYLESITRLLVDDLKTEFIKEKTILFHILYGSEFKGDEYFDIAKELFLRSNEHPRNLQLNYSFAMERADLPSISLSTPSESTDDQLNALGMGEEGFITKEGPDGVDKQYPIISRSYKASVNIVISSSNFIEQTIIYHVYRDLLSSIFPQIGTEGFINPKLSGREVQINPELILTNIYVRSLILDFSYTKSILASVGRDIITKFCEDGPTQILIKPGKK